jgi:hypothetical protein
MTVQIVAPEGGCQRLTRVKPERASELRAEVEALAGWRIFIVS